MDSYRYIDKFGDYKINGIVVSLLVSLSSLVYTFANIIFGGIWAFFTTILVVAFMGDIIGKINNKVL